MEISKETKKAVKDVMDSIGQLIEDYGSGRLHHASFVAMMKSDIAELERITRGL